MIGEEGERKEEEQRIVFARMWNLRREALLLSLCQRRILAAKYYYAPALNFCREAAPRCASVEPLPRSGATLRGAVGVSRLRGRQS